MNATPILRTLNLSIGYKSAIADEISIALNRRSLIGLVGSNGVGKTTLLRTIIKEQIPLSGDIFLNETSIKKIPASYLARQLSVVLTTPLASKNITVEELVSLGRTPYTNWIGRLSEADKQAINEAFELTQIGALKHKKCYELSDGQLQIALIARALAQDTPLIILDEPTTHLDLNNKARLYILLRELVKTKQKTILFSTHDMSSAIQLCDSLIVMTKTETLQNSPCKLISEGVFNTLFPSDSIEFDDKTGHFNIKRH